MSVLIKNNGYIVDKNRECKWNAKLFFYIFDSFLMVLRFMFLNF